MALQVTWTARASATSSQVTQAKKYLLVLSDMPKGWKTEKGTGGGGPSQVPGAKQLASCLGISAKLINENAPTANGPYYENGDGSLEVQDSVTVFPSAQNAKANLAALGNPKTPGCMTTFMNTPKIKAVFAGGQKGTTIGTITVAATSPAVYGANTAGFTMSLPITSQGISLVGHIAIVYFLKGKLGQQLNFNAYGRTFPTSFASHLMVVAKQRL
ncbi:MAG TPA: hypothetical protein VK277_05170 [Acidimicrobiales bacterium]|nr:hypothetical protein [Acidimicrobiales bacterium]